MENTAWVIDPETHDLVFDESGILQVAEGNEATAQNIRLALEAFQGDFPLVPSHGADYSQILGQPFDEDTADEVIREAAFQEPRLTGIGNLSVAETTGRGIKIEFSGELNDGAPVNMEVKVGE